MGQLGQIPVSSPPLLRPSYKDHLPVRLLSFVIVRSLLVVCNRLGTETSRLNATSEVEFLVRAAYSGRIHKSFPILRTKGAASRRAAGLLVERGAALGNLTVNVLSVPNSSGGLGQVTLLLR